MQLLLKQDSSKTHTITACKNMLMYWLLGAFALQLLSPSLGGKRITGKSEDGTVGRLQGRLLILIALIGGPLSVSPCPLLLRLQPVYCCLTRQVQGGLIPCLCFRSHWASPSSCFSYWHAVLNALTPALAGLLNCGAGKRELRGAEVLQESRRWCQLAEAACWRDPPVAAVITTW